MNAVEAAFQPVLGLPCWGVQCGYGSFLTLEFGQPRLEVVEPRPVPSGASEKRFACALAPLLAPVKQSVGSLFEVGDFWKFFR